jgi:hypothetical protein
MPLGFLIHFILNNQQVDDPCSHVQWEIELFRQREKYGKLKHNYSTRRFDWLSLSRMPLSTTHLACAPDAA